MSSPPARFDPEELLAELGWVRALARQMTGDAHVAEDLTQDALLIALGGTTSESSPKNAPSAERPAALRRWFAAVLRNLGRTRRRGERRRAEREAQVARRELAPATVELIERAATQRALVGALLRLREPYRSTLLLRFHAGCTQREIAAQTGVPVSTVATRIAEGIERLRRKVGSRDRWLSALGALLPWPQRAGAVAQLLGVLFMSVQTKLILAVVVAVGLCSLWYSEPDVPAPGGVPPAGSSAAAASAVADAMDVEREDASGTPPDAASSARFDEIPAHAGLVRVRVRGQVLDVAGAPVAGVEVQRVSEPGRMADTGALVPARVLGSADADAAGRFEIEGVPPFALQVRDERFTTVCQGVVGRSTTQEVLILVAPRIGLGGVVVDGDGSPVGGVRVTFLAKVGRAGHDLSTSRMVYPEVSTDERGTFSFGDAGSVAGARLQFRAALFDLETLEVPVGGDPAMYVVMNKTASSTYTITGRVVLADGAPAVGALVSTGVVATRVDERGAFAFDFEPWLRLRVDEDAPTVVTAVRAGLLPATRTLPSVREARTKGWPNELVLRLQDTPRTIRGVVVDETGAPVAGVLVEPDDLTPFGVVPEQGMPAFSGSPKSLEQLAGGGATQTAADGTFELRGLTQRNYSICVLQRPSLLCAVSPPVLAGEQGVRIVLDRRGLGTIRGRIVGRDGIGIGGVRVAVSRERITELVIGSSAVTAADGTFDIDGVTREPAFLRLEGEAIVPELFRRLDANADLSALELTVGRRRRVQFDWGAWPGREDELRVVDERDQPLTMMLMRGNSIGERHSINCGEGVSDTLMVADTAAFAVVYREGREVTRVRLDLVGEDLHVIRL